MDDQVEVVQRPFQDVDGQLFAHGEDLVAGADPDGGVGKFGGASGGGADVVEVELQQPGLLVGGGEADDQRV